MADDLHEVLGADAIDPLLQRETRRRGSELPGSRTKIAGAQRAHPGQKLALPRLFLYPGATKGPCYRPPFHSHKEATLLQTQHQIRKYPLL